MTEKERSIIRELAKRYAECAALDINRERIERIRRINHCEPCRPVVWIHEVPWHEMNIDGKLTLACDDERAKGIEMFFRRELFKWEYFQADTVLRNHFAVQKRWRTSGIGVRVSEQTLETSADNYIVSHQYEDQLDTEEKLEQLKCPVVTRDTAQEKAAMDYAGDLLGDILPVRLQGTYISFQPWDDLAQIRGVEPILMDIALRPDFLHRIMEKLAAFQQSVMLQMQQLNLLDSHIDTLHSTPPDVCELPAEGHIGGHTRLEDVWYRGMAQMFSSVSPAAHQEFDLDYIRPLAEQCGLVYYGCCEPLHDRIDRLKTIHNLRKIGVSAWADVRKSAEQIEGRYVFARKPNPAFVTGSFDADIVARETRETLEACMANNCPCEIVLKDISTVSNRPGNLIEWNRVVQETIDRVYR